MREFNTTGVCIPEEHYMVDITEKLQQIIKLIEKKKYFTINRGRQYGKTTTFALLERNLAKQYDVVSVSFEGMGSQAFSSDAYFVRQLITLFTDAFAFTDISEERTQQWSNCEDLDEYMEKRGDAFDYLSKKITSLCKDNPKEILLFVDEVDKSSDNQIFLHFLGMLRNKYLQRARGRDFTFKSVILAGVYDIKNLKLKLRPEDEKKYNSPWNVAVDFNVDMSFSPREIETMLLQYEEEHNTGMDTEKISQEIYTYTSGYPYLVSWICKWIDENQNATWSMESIQKAIKELMNNKNCTLLDDLKKNVENNQQLKQLIMNMLYEGKQYTYNVANPVIELGEMFAIFSKREEMLAISNKIFELYLYNYSISVKETEDDFSFPERNQFIENGKLDMELVLIKFQEFIKAEYRKEDGKFIEQQGRLLFLCFLKPIIIGTGFYYVEPETRNSERMDIVVSYGTEEFIIELKIWHGGQYRKKGIAQLEKYMNCRNAKRGYLVSFSFLENKEYKAEWMTKKETEFDIFEVVI